MLTASEIKAQVESGELGWPGEMRGNSLLLRLGSPLQALMEPDAHRIVDLADQATIDALYESSQRDWKSFDLAPGRIALCQAQPSLRLGRNLAGAISTLSHLARVGLATHVTSPWIMAGWDGQLTLELFNVGPAALRLRPGLPVARVVIFRMEGASNHVSPHPFYGFGQLGSRYAEEFGHL